jgi:transposase-like protein
VPRPPYPRDVADFNRMFPDEEACIAYLAACRWPRGFRCPRCGEREAFDLPRRRLWQCKACRHQTSVTAGTVMHRTRTPLLTWFWAAFWMTAHKPGLSALQLQHMLGLARYETAWLILHKLRRAMVDANREPLKGTVEIGETLIGGEQPGLRGGRQVTGRKALLVAVAVEVRGKGPGRVRAEVIADATAATLSRFIVRNIKPGSTVLSDGHRGFQEWEAAAALGSTHLPRTQECFRLAGTEDVVPHAHRAISNLKAWLSGTHRGVGADQLPVYLAEFVFRWNRRHAPMAGFPALLGLGTHREPTTYAEILGAPSTPGAATSRGRKTGLTRATATDDPRPAG